MHIHNPNDLNERGTTSILHFDKVMLLDFSLHNLSEVCYWTRKSIRQVLHVYT